MLLRAVLLACLALFSLTGVRAATLFAEFIPTGPEQWRAEFTLLNDGVPAGITGFTVYFPHETFRDLSLGASPAAWDSLVIQPDVALQSPGFLDAQALDLGAPLLLGQSQGGFAVLFEYTGLTPPPMLSFEIVDPEFNVLFSGVTTPIPEPAAFALLIAGLAVLIPWLSRRRRDPSLRLAA